jgi:hypothetical protein
MLDLHHQRMVARLRNIMHTLRQRACPAGTAADEIAFLALEAEAYRAFIYAHADVLNGLVGPGVEEDLRTAADSLYFDVLNLSDRAQESGVRTPTVTARVSRVSAGLLDLAQRCQLGIQKGRADRLALFRELAGTSEGTAGGHWPLDPTLSRTSPAQGD